MANAYIDFLTISQAIEGLLEGALGSTRTVTSGLLEKGDVYDGRETTAQRADVMLTPKFSATPTSVSNNDGSPVSFQGNLLLRNVQITIRCVYPLKSEVQTDQRDAVLSTVVNKLSIAVSALATPGNLSANATPTNTYIVGGYMSGPDGTGFPTWDLEDEDWESQMISATISGRVIVEQTLPTS